MPNILKDVDYIKGYINRQTDNFKYIGRHTFRYMYNQRARFGIYKAYPTPMLDFFTKIILTKLKMEIVENEKTEQIEVRLNTWPYYLTDAEIAVILKGLQMKMPPSVIVLPLREKPSYELYNSFHTVIDYSGMEVINNMFVLGKISPGKRLSTNIIIPALVDEDIVYNTIDRDGFLEDFIKLLDSVVDVDMLEPKVFSMTIPDKPEEENNTEHTV